MRKVAIPCLYELRTAGIVSYLFVWGLGLNAGTAGMVVLLGIAAMIIRTAVRERRDSAVTSRSDK